MKKYKDIIFFFSILLIIILISFYFKNFLTVEFIQSNKLLIHDFVNQYFILTIFLFLIGCVVLINSPVPLAGFFKILGGFLFGFYLGAVLNIIFTIIACTLSFLLSRFYLHNYFQNKYRDELEKINKEIEENGFEYILSLRIMLIMPYFAINFISGVSKISFRKYFLATALGVILPSFIYAYLGQELENVDTLSQLLSFEIFSAMFLVGFLILLPTLIKLMKKYKK